MINTKEEFPYTHDECLPPDMQILSEAYTQMSVMATGVTLPDGYEFQDQNGNVIKAKKIVLTKKPKYPQTYAKCCEILGARYCIPAPFDARIKNEYPQETRILDLLYDMRRLLICRDTYWKLAEDWKPDYDSGVDKFGICCYDGVIVKTNAVQHWERHYNKVLDFPTAEMRDAFYENFKELINECKELI